MTINLRFTLVLDTLVLLPTRYIVCEDGEERESRCIDIYDICMYVYVYK